VSERNFGVIPDRLAWDLPLTALTVESGPFQLFSAGAADAASKPRALARSESLGLYLRRFPEGGGENGLHSHDQDAIWFVVEGGADFFEEGGTPIASLGPDQGLLVPRLIPYGFVCTETSLLLRFAGAPGA